ncbi:MAG: hypothetical protein Q8O84_01520 [Nanoarchaeota archaeon]|nr:hypothetical protein [Nanoarchaeota archaeon]
MSKKDSQYTKNLGMNIDGDLYKTLSEKPIEVVKRFYDFNQYKSSRGNLFSTFQIQTENNLTITKKVLEERTK